MKTRMRIGLVVVVACAIVLSFSGLYSLAVACGFARPLAMLVPILADAGAAVAADVWLTGAVAPAVQAYARRLALATPPRTYWSCSTSFRRGGWS